MSNKNGQRLAGKPLEINGLNHHRCLENKGVCDLSQANSGRLYLTPFYSLPMRFAGASAGTFVATFIAQSWRLAAALRVFPLCA